MCADGQGLLGLGQVFGADDHRRCASVPRDGDSLVLALDAVDDVAEGVSDLPQRLNAHDHSRGASCGLPQPAARHRR